MAFGKTQFGRNYSLVFGPRNPANPADRGILVKDLRIVFSINKTLETAPNAAIVEIYNLAKTTRARIEDGVAKILKNAQGVEDLVNIPTMILNVGYGDDLKNIFIGDVAQITTKRDGPDIVTSFDIGDGASTYADAKLDVSFGPGTKFPQVLNALREKMGLTLGSVIGINPTDQFQNGVTISGPAKDSLTKILSRQDLSWSIQDNKLQILPATSTTNDVAVLLNKSTGLIGSPFKAKVLNDTLVNPQEANASSSKSGKAMKSGLQCQILLNPEIKPGRQIKVESENVSGTFKVTKLRHYGDTHSAPWYTEIVAE